MRIIFRPVSRECLLPANGLVSKLWVSLKTANGPLSLVLSCRKPRGNHLKRLHLLWLPKGNQNGNLDKLLRTPPGATPINHPSLPHRPTRPAHPRPTTLCWRPRRCTAARSPGPASPALPASDSTLFFLFFSPASVREEKRRRKNSLLFEDQILLVTHFFRTYFSGEWDVVLGPPDLRGQNSGGGPTFFLFFGFVYF